MLQDVAIGQYYDADSFVHRLDPRTKVVGTFIFIIELFLVKNFLGFILAALMLLAVVKLSKIPLRFLIKGQRTIAILLLFTVILNLFMIKGEVLVRIGPLSISKQGLYTACFMAVRLILLVVGCSIMTLTTTPLQLTDGLEKLLRPLKAVKVPVHDIAMMMSIALRFIPILMEETDKIMKAQAARGADFESGSLVQRAKSLVPVLVPLFISAFRRADDLATAMEARCYHGDDHRTRMKDLTFTRADYASFIMIGVSVALIIVSRYAPGFLEMAGRMMG